MFAFNLSKFFLIAALIYCTSFSRAFADDFRVAVVDMDKLETNSIAVKKLKSSLKKEEEKIVERLKKERKNAKKKVEKLQKISGSLSKSALLQKQEALQKELMALDKKLQAMAKDVQDRRAKALKLVNEKIRDISEELAEEEGISIVLSSLVVLSYSKDKEVDITKRVLVILNKELKEVEF